jgi:ribonuclease-3
LGYKFRDLSLLKLALTHPSITQDQASPRHHNQRLEFLGDAVLQLILTLALYERFPDLDEGPMTKARAQMVNRTSLAAHSRKLELGSHLIISRGEELHGGRGRASTLADALEAVFGAVLMDGGFEAARNVILREFEESITELPLTQSTANPKGELQEWLQASSTEPPHYRMASATGPDHDREFECIVIHEGVELARGQGKSKKIAESNAALGALELLKQKQADSGGKPPRRRRKPKTTAANPTSDEKPV